MDKVQKIREEVARIQLYTQSEVLKQVLDYIDKVQEEPVSDDLNTESMIESYKQRLISQANGMKNSPLIDMCLVSYKHGINETLDTLKLSNIERTVKKWKEEPVERTPADIEAAMQEVEDKSKAFTEAHKDESADDILAQMRGEEPISEDLEEASKEWLIPQLDKSYANYGETKMMELTHFDGYAMLDAIEFGANWQKAKDQSTIELAEDHAMRAGMETMKEEMMVKAVDAELYSDGMLTPIIKVSDKEKISNIKFGDKIKLIIIKDE